MVSRDWFERLMGFGEDGYASTRARLRARVNRGGRPARGRPGRPQRPGHRRRGNVPQWIDDAINRALSTVEHAGLDIRLVDYGRVDASSQAIADRWG